MCIWVCVSVSVVKKNKNKKEGVFDEILDWQLEGEERKREKKEAKKGETILCNLCECACR